MNQSASTHGETTSISQQENGTNVPNEGHIVLMGCSTDSDGTGKIDVYCPNYGTFHLSREPPIKASKWDGVKLTVDNGKYTIQYTTPTGTNQYDLSTTGTQGTSLKIFSSTKNDIQQIIGNVFQKTVTKSSATKEELYQYALGVINKDRTDHGVQPITLSNMSSAQSHAEDMLNAGYFSHWNSDGVKPYVTYTKLGGKDNVDENISVTSTYCPSSDCAPYSFDPFKQINDSEYGMMYKDAGSNWGHRDNIIDPEHTSVSFGIAYNNEKFYFVEHFENNIINWQTMKIDGNQLHLVGQIPAGYALYQIEVFSDPSPVPLASKDLNGVPPYNAGYYDQGDFVGVMLPRPAVGSHYPECSPGKAILDTTKGETCVDYVTFTNISTALKGIDISPNISKWMGPGLHTIYMTLKKQNGEQVYASSVTLEYL
ncbi:MAG TPA: CAP domain-containing protein [Candidatus Nitrosotalea sp.]|nr:CAP domain-containing protein [Candidatus Nitrosotalea sp.]